MNDITTRARALHSVAEARERLMERELLAIWATVRSGNPAPLTELEVLHAVEDVRRERDALRAEVERLRAELASVMGECARLRSDVDVEREQSAVFVKEIERLRVVEAGAAIMRRVLNEVGRYAEWASTVREALRDGAGNDFLFRLLSAECDLAHVRQELAFDRKYAEQALDAASAEKERLRAEIEKERAEVERLRARIDAVGCVLAESGCECPEATP